MGCRKISKAPTRGQKCLRKLALRMAHTVSLAENKALLSELHCDMVTDAKLGIVKNGGVKMRGRPRHVKFCLTSIHESDGIDAENLNGDPPPLLKYDDGSKSDDALFENDSSSREIGSGCEEFESVYHPLDKKDLTEFASVVEGHRNEMHGIWCQFTEDGGKAASVK